MKNNIKKSLWFNAIFFGLIGQIAWVVENMYFTTFAQDIFANSNRYDMSYLVTTLMVIFSALCATLTTIFAGGKLDKLGKRKPFISYGYIIWGITIMVFGLIPMKVKPELVVFIGLLLVLFDCVMTIAGSTSNDAAFNAWVCDNTNPSNRGKVNGVLAMMPVFAVVVVFIGLGPLYNKDNTSNMMFFVLLGLIPLIAGIISIFTLKDADVIEKNETESLKEAITYGFKKDVIKSNKIVYIALLVICIIGIAQQTFFSYLINFLIITLELGDGFVIPMAVIIVGAAIVTGLSGMMSDKIGRNKLYIPLLVITVLGIFSFYFIQFLSPIKLIILYVGGILMMGGILGLNGILTACFQDYIPKNSIGKFQGVRMCFMVLIPMIIGPIISLIIGLNAMGLNGADFIPPYTMFLAAGIVAITSLIPIVMLIKLTKK